VGLGRSRQFVENGSNEAESVSGVGLGRQDQTVHAEDCPATALQVGLAWGLAALGTLHAYIYTSLSVFIMYEFSQEEADLHIRACRAGADLPNGLQCACCGQTEKE
jgi:hypothetical protein